MLGINLCECDLVAFAIMKIFLGDGGAYLLGFLVAFLLIILTQDSIPVGEDLGESLKNAIFKTKVSAYYGLCIAIYPVFEVIFSIWRKKFWRKMSAMKPDSIHFHMVIFKRITKSNHKTSIFIWLFNVPFIALGSVFYDNLPVLIALIALFILLYLYLYFKIIRFK